MLGLDWWGLQACSDVMKSQVQVDKKRKIVDTRFETSGCGSAIASQLVSHRIGKGKTVEGALTIKNTDLARSCACRLWHCMLRAGWSAKGHPGWNYERKTEPQTEEAGERNEPLVMPWRSHRLPGPSHAHTGVQKPSRCSNELWDSRTVAAHLVTLTQAKYTAWLFWTLWFLAAHFHRLNLTCVYLDLCINPKTEINSEVSVDLGIRRYKYLVPESFGGRLPVNALIRLFGRTK